MNIAVDFGTSRTVVASIEAGNYPVCTFSFDGEDKEYVPSLVAAKGSEMVYGWEAAACLDDPGVTFVRSLKRLVGKFGPGQWIEVAPDRSVQMAELVTGYLTQLRHMINNQSSLASTRGKKTLDAVVAVPATATSNQRYIMMEAFRTAGFNVSRMMNEPSAAAIEFVHRHLQHLGPRSPKKYVVVYDLGGGTFDASAVSFEGKTYEVIAHRGLPHLGGDDFDQVILDQALAHLEFEPHDLGQHQVARLLEECRERKEGLSPKTRKLIVDLSMEIPDSKSAVLLTQEVYQDCAPLIQQSVQVVEGLLEKLCQMGCDSESTQSMAAIYVVGGSASFPPVARVLREQFGRKVKISPFPHAATAIGLAIAGDPNARIEVQESMTRHFGVWREQAGGEQKVFDPIFVRDSKTGSAQATVATRTYRPAHNIGHLRYLECAKLGEIGEPEGQILVWKEVFFPYDPALQGTTKPKKLAQLEVKPHTGLSDHEVLETYTYTASGMIQVEIVDQTTGYRQVHRLISA